jgi:hypothetical protein
MMLTKAECIARFELVDHLFRCVGEVDRNVLMFVYGSFSSYLSLPESDVDLTIVTYSQYRYILKLQRHIRAIFERSYEGKASKSKTTAFRDSLVDVVSLRCMDTLSSSSDGESSAGADALFPRVSAPKAAVCSLCGSVMLGGNCDCSVYAQIEKEREGARTIEMQKNGRGNFREWGAASAVPFSPSLLASGWAKEVAEGRPAQDIRDLNSPLQSSLDFSCPIFFYTNQNVMELLSRVSMPKFVFVSVVFVYGVYNPV